MIFFFNSVLFFFFVFLSSRRKSRVIQPLVDRKLRCHAKEFSDLPFFHHFVSLSFFFNKINDVFDRLSLFFLSKISTNR